MKHHKIQGSLIQLRSTLKDHISAELPTKQIEVFIATAAEPSFSSIQSCLIHSSHGVNAKSFPQ